MSTSHSFNVDITVDDATQRAPLGQIYVMPPNFWDRGLDTAGVGGFAVDQGESHWVYVGMAAANTVAQGYGVMRAAGSSTFGSALLSTATINKWRMIGVGQGAITASQFGWVLRKGHGAGYSDAAIADGAPIAAANGGSGQAGAMDDLDLTTAINNSYTFGLCLDTVAGADTLFDAWFNCAGS